MPIALEVDGFRVRIYPREHRPAHVHVVKGGGEIVLLLGDGDEPPTIRDRRGMTNGEAVKAYRIVRTHQALLRDAWRRYHGQ